MPPPPGNIATRVSLAGMYSFQFQGWLRAHDESGHFLTPDPASRPRKIETAVVMAGFQSPPDPPNPNNPERRYLYRDKIRTPATTRSERWES